MGSFNEICALSGLPITYNDKVRLLFLTRNPYVESDQHEAHRGCYHYDQWFLRTPPIKGKYADYGRCDFEHGAISRLIESVFKNDIVERPFGFNQYHTGDVTKSKGIHNFLQAAWQGRLLVADLGSKKSLDGFPVHYPTWEKVHYLLKEAKLPLQLDSDKDSGEKGFNAQPVIDGVVCLTWNEYSNQEENLVKAQAILENKYECNLVYEHKPKNNPCLMVTVKGAKDDPSMLLNVDLVHRAITNHPSSERRSILIGKQLPVLAVMVLEDVWQEYCNIDIADGYREELSVSDLVKKIRDICEKVSYSRPGSALSLGIDFALRGVFLDMPFQTTIGIHLDKCLEKDEHSYSDVEKQEVIQACAEAARVEQIMGILHQSWHIPSLGGQENEWEMRVKLLDSITNIARKRIQE